VGQTRKSADGSRYRGLVDPKVHGNGNRGGCILPIVLSSQRTDAF
jgi:hypothetical protein